MFLQSELLTVNATIFLLHQLDSSWWLLQALTAHYTHIVAWCLQHFPSLNTTTIFLQPQQVPLLPKPHMWIQTPVRQRQSIPESAKLTRCYKENVGNTKCPGIYILWITWSNLSLYVFILLCHCCKGILTCSLQCRFNSLRFPFWVSLSVGLGSVPVFHPVWSRFSGGLWIIVLLHDPDICLYCMSWCTDR